MNFPDLDRYPYIAYDTETTGLRFPKDRAFGVSIATPDGNSHYWDLRTSPGAREWLERILPGYKGLVICHYASFDYRMSLAAGLTLPLLNLDDTRIRAALLDEHRTSYSLDDLAWDFLRERKESNIYQDMANLFGGRPTRNVQMKLISEAPPEIVSKYAAKDALLTLRLWEDQEDQIKQQDNPDIDCPSLQDIMEFERVLLPIFIDMECHGVRVDEAEAIRAQNEVDEEIDKAKKQLHHLVGGDINVNSVSQVRSVFNPVFGHSDTWTVNGTVIPSTPTGAPSLSSPVLDSLQDERAQLILRIRSLIKTRDTFLGGHVLGHAVGGRVFPTINQTKGEDGGTGTGRLSYQEPALQQIPSRDKQVAKIVKRVFLPDPGQQWLDVDESSFEVRVFAHLVAQFDPRIADMYQEDPDTDLHQYVADETGLPRNATGAGKPYAKQLNLAMIFNQGNGSTAEKMGLPWTWEEFEAEDGHLVRYKKPGEEAKAIIDRYHEKLPGVKTLMEAAKRIAMARGFIYTFRGRRIRFPNGYKTYKASGLLIQSTAADFNKENIKIIHKYINANGGRLLLNTHDSYSMSIPKGSYSDLWPRLRAQLERKDRARVPLLIDVSGVGSNWWSALKNEAGVRT
jgi:DNA polymerase I-like protein with 3'-5' exonuclease and polymerase domains